MYFTRLTLLKHPNLPALLHRLGDAYREHQMLWQLFEPDPNAKRDFLYRRDVYHGVPRYFILSKRPPVNSLGLWHIDPPKPFRPMLQSGQRLAFMLRVNPVVSRDGKRHDVVTDRKLQMGWKNLPIHERPPLSSLIQESGIDWLQQRAERYGFSFVEEAVRVDGYHLHRTRRNSRLIRFSSMDFSGLLTVNNPDLFINAIKNGIGPAKAFGCGLMLIRKIN